MQLIENIVYGQCLFVLSIISNQRLKGFKALRTSIGVCKSDIPYCNRVTLQFLGQFFLVDRYPKISLMLSLLTHILEFYNCILSSMAVWSLVAVLRKFSPASDG